MKAFRMLKCLLIRNGCYVKYHDAALKPRGIVVHATDPAGKVLSRFVQPCAGQTEGMEINGKPATETEMLAVLGKNKYNNHWNRVQDVGKEACVHAFVGLLADGSIAAVQTLPWTQPCWGAVRGSKGSYDGRDKNGNPADDLYIHIEQIEGAKDGKDAAYCNEAAETTVKLCAYLMRQFPTIKLENIVSHKEAHARGYASDHGDPESWWKRQGTGMNMDTFRALVAEELTKPDPDAEPAPRHPFVDVPVDGTYYSNAVQAAWEAGIVRGIDETHFAPDEPCTRAQVVTMIMRAVGYIENVLRGD